jgi:hypothetical protein
MTTIETGELIRTDGSKVACSVVHGWNPKASLECDTMWKQASFELLSHIMAQNYDDKELIEVVSSISMEDDHWRWFDKARPSHQRKMSGFICMRKTSHRPFV